MPQGAPALIGRAAFARKHKEGAFPLKGLRKIIEELNRDWESYFAIEITDGLVRLAGDNRGNAKGEGRRGRRK